MLKLATNGAVGAVGRLGSAGVGLSAKTGLVLDDVGLLATTGAEKSERAENRVELETGATGDKPEPSEVEEDKEESAGTSAGSEIG